jgi:diguanylate cyclase (GGDEF)-like protein
MTTKPGAPKRLSSAGTTPAKPKNLEPQRVMALLEACQALTTSLVLDEVMDLICKGVGQAFGLASVDIYEYVPERDEIVVIWSFMPARPEEATRFVGTTYSLEENPLYRRAFDTNGVVEYDVDDEELASTEPELIADMKEWGEKSVVEAGLFFGGEVMGLLSVGSTDEVLHFGNGDKELFLAFAATAAVAIHNAQLYRTIEEQAIRDGLTGLYNHRFFYERLQSELARGTRYGTPVALLMIDVDDFKSFNDRHGHRVGDEVLRTVARALEGDVRRELDIVCRYGGDEFSLILPHTPIAATQVAERLRRRISEATISLENGKTAGTVTVSIGVAAYPGSATDVDGLVTVADEALYVAKSGGRNRVEAAAGSDE